MDRHFFSEPRPVDGCQVDLPTWEVDVFREGVPEPVFTLEINKHTLPPRMRKKKVVWKLPEDIEETPNFGSDERKRMLELFRREKKTRKKELKRSSSGTAAADGATAVEEPQRVQGDSQHQQQQEEIRDVQRQQTQTEDTCKPQTNGEPPGFITVHQDADTEVRNNHVEPEPPDTNGHSSMHDPLPPQPPMPPPGFAAMSLHHQDLDEHPQSTASIPTPNSAFFTVTPLSTNIPVDLAKNAVDNYYPLMTSGQSELLLQYFTIDCQKSLSVGGAHAVCHSRDECLLQLQSLQGFQFGVKGVVAQPGIHSSVVLLITGNVQNATTVQLWPFCHSLTLILIDNAQDQFQIQNDAMALLTE